ncbi:hypothetical protein AX15_006102 [Amanita polypyramis BW_CC]|nr:hypothetical protein AX15_006102 [Amanita polypyramis BW_CC]
MPNQPANTITAPPATNTNANQAGGNNNNNNANGSSSSSIISNNANTNSSAGSSSHINIPQSAPAGSITITQPPETATSYFKLAPSYLVTFAWNFTDVIVTPTHLTVSAAADNGNTYPVGPTNGIIPGTATSVVWDIYSYQQANPATPLAQATYTLMIWDDRGPNSPRVPGFMVPNDNLRFAIYTPQPYTGLGDGQFPPFASFRRCYK